MIIECGYKQDNYCKYYKKEIEESKEKCCDTCHHAVEVYTDKDRANLLYEALKTADKEKSAYDVAQMQGIYGHSCALENDFDDLFYKGYNLWLVLHKKYKYIKHSDIVTAYNCMQQMGIKIPKRIRREIRRIKSSSSVLREKGEKLSKELMEK